MRHNAAISIITTEADGPQELNLFLSAFGSPNEVKVISRKAIRKMRRHFDGERFYINLIKLAPGQVNIFSLAAEYLWRYEFNFTGKIPKLNIIHASNGISRKVGLYRWLGPERKISEKEAPLNPEHYGKRKRGRPTALSKTLSQYYVPAPEEVRPDGTIIYGDARDKVNQKRIK